MEEEYKIEKTEDIEERKHFKKVLEAFRYYQTSALRKLKKKESDFLSLSKEHQSMVPKFLPRLAACKEAVDVNYKFIRQVIAQVDDMFSNFDYSTNGELSEAVVPLTGDDMDRVRTTLTQLVRDWASEGAPERESSYSLILQELEGAFKCDTRDRNEIRVLVPGAGLGRLMFEVAQRGFSCQGNEFSLYMLFVSNYVLNCCSQENQVTVVPWVHQFNNVLKRGDPLRYVCIPDVTPSDIKANVEFSMVAGDFLEVYNKEEDWDCVLTCFFIDTAHNVISYVEKIHHILKKGGVWINFGPLLYHFSDMPNELSIELSYEEVREVVLNKFKFSLIKEETGLKSSYNQNPRSLLQMAYDCVLFVVRKT